MDPPEYPQGRSPFGHTPKYKFKTPPKTTRFSTSTSPPRPSHTGSQNRTRRDGRSNGRSTSRGRTYNRSSSPRGFTPPPRYDDDINSNDHSSHWSNYDAGVNQSTQGAHFEEQGEDHVNQQRDEFDRMYGTYGRNDDDEFDPDFDGGGKPKAE